MDSEKLLAEAQALILPALLLAAQRLGLPRTEEAFVEYVAEYAARALLDHPARLQAPIVIVEDRT
jgi:hypothetical protein